MLLLLPCKCVQVTTCCASMHVHIPQESEIRLQLIQQILKKEFSVDDRAGNQAVKPLYSVHVHLGPEAPPWPRRVGKPMINHGDTNQHTMCCKLYTDATAAHCWSRRLRLSYGSSPATA